MNLMTTDLSIKVKKWKILKEKYYRKGLKDNLTFENNLFIDYRHLIDFLSLCSLNTSNKNNFERL